LAWGAILAPRTGWATLTAKAVRRICRDFLHLFSFSQQEKNKNHKKQPLKNLAR
jgi:hypothetical protein